MTTVSANGGETLQEQSELLYRIRKQRGQVEDWRIKIVEAKENLKWLKKQLYGAVDDLDKIIRNDPEQKDMFDGLGVPDDDEDGGDDE